MMTDYGYEHQYEYNHWGAAGTQQQQATPADQWLGNSDLDSPRQDANQKMMFNWNNNNAPAPAALYAPQVHHQQQQQQGGYGNAHYSNHGDYHSNKQYDPYYQYGNSTPAAPGHHQYGDYDRYDDGAYEYSDHGDYIDHQHDVYYQQNQQQGAAPQQEETMVYLDAASARSDLTDSESGHGSVIGGVTGQVLDTGGTTRNADDEEDERIVAILQGRATAEDIAIVQGKTISEEVAKKEKRKQNRRKQQSKPAATAETSSPKKKTASKDKKAMDGGVKASRVFSIADDDGGDGGKGDVLANAIRREIRKNTSSNTKELVRNGNMTRGGSMRNLISTGADLGGGGEEQGRATRRQSFRNLLAATAAEGEGGEQAAPRATRRQSFRNLMKLANEAEAEAAEEAAPLRRRHSSQNLLSAAAASLDAGAIPPMKRRGSSRGLMMNGGGGELGGGGPPLRRMNTDGSRESRCSRGPRSLSTDTGALPPLRRRNTDDSKESRSSRGLRTVSTDTGDVGGKVKRRASSRSPMRIGGEGPPLRRSNTDHVAARRGGKRGSSSSRPSKRSSGSREEKPRARRVTSEKSKGDEAESLRNFAQAKKRHSQRMIGALSSNALDEAAKKKDRNVRRNRSAGSKRGLAAKDDEDENEEDTKNATWGDVKKEKKPMARRNSFSGNLAELLGTFGANLKGKSKTKKKQGDSKEEPEEPRKSKKSETKEEPEEPKKSKKSETVEEPEEPKKKKTETLKPSGSCNSFVSEASQSSSRRSKPKERRSSSKKQGRRTRPSKENSNRSVVSKESVGLQLDEDRSLNDAGNDTVPRQISVSSDDDACDEETPSTTDFSGQQSFISGLDEGTIILAPEDMRHWKCACGEVNEKMFRFCGMCREPQKWTCALCKFEANKCRFKYCGNCASPKLVLKVDATKLLPRSAGSDHSLSYGSAT